MWSLPSPNAAAIDIGNALVLPVLPASYAARCPPLFLPCPRAPQVRVAVASGIGNARALLQRMQAGEAHYDFVEVRWRPAARVCPHWRV